MKLITYNIEKSLRKMLRRVGSLSMLTNPTLIWVSDENGWYESTAWVSGITIDEKDRPMLSLKWHENVLVPISSVVDKSLPKLRQAVQDVYNVEVAKRANGVCRVCQTMGEIVGAFGECYTCFEDWCDELKANDMHER